MTATKSAVALFPTSDHVVVRRECMETHSVPNLLRTPVGRGLVLAVGLGHRLQDGTLAAMEVSVGMTVLFQDYAGFTVEVDDEELTVLREADIVAIVP